jgi:hypothetical protein
MKKILTVLSLLITVLLLFNGFLLLLLGIGQYEGLRSFLDQFARDGSLESFSVDLHNRLRIPLALIGSILFVLGGLSVTMRERFKHALHSFLVWLPVYAKATWEDARVFGKELRLKEIAWWEWLLLIVLMSLAFAGRWVWIDRPMMHDESYTFIAFAQRGLRAVMSDYHLPNNHIFNTILIHVLYRWFGNAGPVIVRLPAFLAGVLLTMSVYLYTRREYGRWQALLACALVAVLPWLKLQSVNGRGYMLMALFTIWMAALSEIVRRACNRFAWLLLVLVSVLNFYTLPVALYPFAILWVWLLFSGILGDIGDEYQNLAVFGKYLLGYGVLTGALTFLLYLPVFLFGSGWDSFFNNPFVARLSFNDFRQTLPIRLAETWRDWTWEVPLVMVVVIIAGLLLYLLLRRAVKDSRVSLPLVTLLVLAVIFAVQRPNPWSRTWTYLLPLLLIWSAAGLVGLIESLASSPAVRKGAVMLMAVLLVGLVVFGVVHMLRNSEYYQGEMGEVETITLWLRDRISEEDIVLASVDFSTAYWYYFDYYDMPMDTVLGLGERDHWQNIYLLMDRREDDAYQSLFTGTPFDPSICPPAMVERVHEYGNFTVFVCDPINP